MLYAALGDSITYGYSATNPNHNFVSLIHRKGFSPIQPNLFILARPGWTSKQLLKSILRTPEVIWDETRYVTLWIGGNDAIRAMPFVLSGDFAPLRRVAERLRANLSSMIQHIRRPKMQIYVANLYNPFPNSHLAEEAIHLLNDAIAGVARQEGVKLVDMYRSLHGRESLAIEGYRRGVLQDVRLRGNPIHPNDDGHRWIAETWLKAISPSRSLSASKRQKKQGRRVLSTQKSTHSLNIRIEKTQRKKAGSGKKLAR
ncbi:SGNH/GDSL hydrolase family protein [Alicyclobacillus sp. TC]|uniref:SGNH/GDSL hydrolase family protein n=1 Tax=Alicyclobacillus sp. TC TaxID=2606450 RepID=UPI0019339C95|nr:SGNH/GDSL hydrolase family protein [Alicyclobacillus sp. TC]